MKVQLSEFTQLPNDTDSNSLPTAGVPNATGQLLTAAGTFSTALANETRYVRIATDTAIHVKPAAGAANTDPMMPANTVEFFGWAEGTVISIILA